MSERSGGLRASFNYDTDLFDEGTIRRMAGHYQRLLEGIVADPGQPISQLPLLTEDERHQMLVEWNDTARGYPADRCVHQLFEEQVGRTPEAVAVVFENQQLTYRELNARSNQLAHYLRDLGVGPEMLVGICLERSLEMVVGLLGILKAGGAYVPLDPEYPAERLAFLLRDSAAPVLLTQKRLLPSLPDCPARVLCLDADASTFAEHERRQPSLPRDPGRPGLRHLHFRLDGGTQGGHDHLTRGIVRLVRNTRLLRLRTRLRPFSSWLRSPLMPPHSRSGAHCLTEVGWPSCPPGTAGPGRAGICHPPIRGSPTLWLTASLFHLWSTAAPRT